MSTNRLNDKSFGYISWKWKNWINCFDLFTWKLSYYKFCGPYMSKILIHRILAAWNWRYFNVLLLNWSGEKNMFNQRKCLFGGSGKTSINFGRRPDLALSHWWPTCSVSACICDQSCDKNQRSTEFASCKTFDVSPW